MSILDKNIEPKFGDLLESLGWYKTEQLNGSYSYTYSRMDCANRYFVIEFFPKGYVSEEISENYDNVVIVKKSRKDLWRVYYQWDYSKMLNNLYYMGMSYYIRMNRENVIQLMNDIKNRTFNPKNYKVIKR